MPSHKQALAESMEALGAVLEQEMLEQEALAAADELVQLLDEAGYDVTVESLEDLVEEVAELLDSGELDEGVFGDAWNKTKAALGKLKTKVQDKLASTSLGQQMRAKGTAAKLSKKYDTLQKDKETAERAGTFKHVTPDIAAKFPDATDRFARAKSAYANVHQQQLGVADRAGIDPKTIDPSSPLPRRLKVNPKEILARGAKLRKAMAAPRKLPHEIRADANRANNREFKRREPSKLAAQKAFFGGRDGMRDFTRDNE